MKYFDLSCPWSISIVIGYAIRNNAFSLRRASYICRWFIWYRLLSAHYFRKKESSADLSWLCLASAVMNRGYGNKMNELSRGLRKLSESDPGRHKRNEWLKLIISYIFRETTIKGHVRNENTISPFSQRWLCTSRNTDKLWRLWKCARNSHTCISATHVDNVIWLEVKTETETLYLRVEVKSSWFVDNCSDTRRKPFHCSVFCHIVQCSCRMSIMNEMRAKCSLTTLHIEQYYSFR